MPKWRNWQTHGTQNPAIAISCGFKSHFRHQLSTPYGGAFLFGILSRDIKLLSEPDRKQVAPGLSLHSVSLSINSPLDYLLYESPRDSNIMWVQVPLSAPKIDNPSHCRSEFGFFTNEYFRFNIKIGD